MIFSINCILFAQPISLITTIDTLPDGKAVVTIEKSDSSFFDRYLMLREPFDWITGSVATPLDAVDSENEYLLKNIDIPDEYGGCFPQGAVYDSANNTFYVYAGRKVIMIDGTTRLKTGDIIISNIDRTTDHNMCLNIKNKIAINQQYSKLYCATEAGTLVIIDLVTNTIISTIDPGIALQELIKTSVIYHNSTNMAYWYVSAGSVGNGINRIGKVDGTSNFETSVNNEIEFGINDIVCNLTGSKLYVANTDGIYEFSCSDLSVEPTSIVTGFNSLCLNYTANNILFAGKEGDNKIYFHEFSTPLNNGYITTTVSGINRIVCNTNENKLYYIGVVGNENETGIRIMDIANYAEISLSQTYNYNYLMGLEYSAINNRIYAGGLGKILSINGDNNAISSPQNTDDGFCTNIVTDNSVSTKILSVQNATGNVMIFNSDLSSSSILDIGNYVISSCVKSSTGKLFIAATKNNFTGSLWIYDLITKSMESFVNLPIPVNAVSISCSDEDNYVFIAGNDVNEYGKVCVYDISTSTFLSSIEIVHEVSHNQIPCKIFKMITDPNGNSYLLTRTVDSSNDPYFFAIDETEIFFDATIPDDLACFQDFIYYDNGIVNPRVFVQSKCSMDIFVYDCTTNNWATPDQFNNMTMAPLSICIDSKNDVIYVGAYKNVLRYDASTYDPLSGFSTNTNRKFIKILSSEYQDKVYACSDDERITILNGYIEIGILVTDYIRDAIYNPLNDQIYLFNTNNNYRTIKVGVLDCNSDQITHTINTGIYYTALKWSDFYGAESKPPSFNLGSNNTTMYTINMPFSNISEIKCNTDRLGLQNGWNWKSFPRMERVDNNYAPTIPVLERVNYFPNLYMKLIENGNDYKEYDNSWTGQLDEVKSSNGYKLELDLTDSPAPEIALYGAKLDPATPITLYPIQENWIGYFIESAQYPWEAFPADLYNNRLTMIKTQYWTLVKINGQWVGTKVTPIKYGDMVIVKINGQSPVSLIWNNPENSSEGEELLKAEHYSFEEQSDYTPIYIQTDDPDELYEIAVKADGECIGATVCMPGDTLVELNAYLQGIPQGTPLEFETWTGYKSDKIGTDGYAVMNPSNGYFEKRRIYKGESSPFYMVSFKQSETTPSASLITGISCSPNPFDNFTTFCFSLIQNTDVELSIYGLDGTKNSTILNGTLAAGYYSFKWNGNTDPGNRLNNGVYIYRLKTTNGEVFSGKVVIIR